MSIPVVALVKVAAVPMSVPAKVTARATPWSGAICTAALTDGASGATMVDAIERAATAKVAAKRRSTIWEVANPK